MVHIPTLRVPHEYFTVFQHIRADNKTGGWLIEDHDKFSKEKGLAIYRSMLKEYPFIERTCFFALRKDRHDSSKDECTRGNYCPKNHPQLIGMSKGVFGQKLDNFA